MCAYVDVRVELKLKLLLASQQQGLYHFQSGGTLFESGKVLKEAGAKSVSAFVTHAVFPNDSWKRFNTGGDRACFDKFWVTNSIPTVTEKLPVDDGIFEVLDLMDLIINDLDHFSSP